MYFQEFCSLTLLIGFDKYDKLKNKTIDNEEITYIINSKQKTLTCDKAKKETVEKSNILSGTEIKNLAISLIKNSIDKKKFLDFYIK